MFLTQKFKLISLVYKNHKNGFRSESSVVDVAVGVVVVVFFSKTKEKCFIYTKNLLILCNSLAKVKHFEEIQKQFPRHLRYECTYV